MLVYICNLNAWPPDQAQRVPWVVPFVGLVLFVYSVMLGRTRLGRYMYAIGANPEAARRAGHQRPARPAARLHAQRDDRRHRRAGATCRCWDRCRPTSPAATYTLYAVAAAVIGGASLFGGRGKPLHALLGGLVIGAVFNGLALMGISAPGSTSPRRSCCSSRRPSTRLSAAAARPARSNSARSDPGRGPFEPTLDPGSRGFGLRPLWLSRPSHPLRLAVRNEWVIGDSRGRHRGKLRTKAGRLTDAAGGPFRHDPGDG